MAEQEGVRNIPYCSSTGTTVIIQDAENSSEQRVLRLRSPPIDEISQQAGISSASGTPQVRRVTWRDDTIDNEGLGRKKSNKCCIFHSSMGASSHDHPCDEDSDQNGPAWNAYEP